MNEKITERWQVMEDPFSETIEIRDEGGRRIAVCVRDFPMSEKTREANAHKIAAVPVLIAALLKIIDMDYMEALHHYGDSSKAENWANVRVAREALAEAGVRNERSSL